MEEKSKIRHLWIPVAVLTAAVPGLVALNLLAVSFSPWIMVLTVSLLIAACVLYVLRSGAGRWAKTLLSAVSAVMIVLGLFAAYCVPYWSSMALRDDRDHSRGYDAVLTLEEAQEDMAQMRSIVSRCHPAFIDEVPAPFDGAYDAALERLAQDGMITVNDLRREIQRTLSVLGDGHTSAYPHYDGQRYLKTIAGHKAEGRSLHAINGMTAKELFEERRELFCYEADSWGVLGLRDNLSTISGLDFLGIDPEGVEYTWVGADGEYVTDTHTAADFLPLDEYTAYNAQYSTGNGQTDSFVRYEIDAENDLAVLTLTACQYDDEYIACLRDMFTEVKALGIGNVAVDLRGNGGGNSLVANEFIRYLPVDTYCVDGYIHRLGCFMLDFTGDKYTVIENRRYTDLAFDGNLYLLTDSGSFSSAMLFAAYIKDNGLGTLIGEPPGNDPNGFGDIAEFRLSNSRLYMSVSTKQFFRPDRECTDRLVMPDVECGGTEAMERLPELLAAE
ncbi:MAG: hypothetical protein E7554_02100 [Ruminococcaceae bacterium]|nr:hypothetical protein [Oscillospiraceae bacterium]